MIQIDIPQVAYKTWAIEYRVYNTDGTRNREMEYEAEKDLERVLSDCRYSSNHDHVA